MSNQAPKYPSDRGQKGKGIFALRYQAYLFHVAEAHSLPDAAKLLLTLVVLAENQLRYQRPVRFWNEQICDKLRIRKERLIEIRKQLVDAGLMVYIRGWKGVAAQYWVTVPGGDDAIADRQLSDNIPDQDCIDVSSHSEIPCGKSYQKKDDQRIECGNRDQNSATPRKSDDWIQSGNAHPIDDEREIPVGNPDSIAHPNPDPKPDQKPDTKANHKPSTFLSTSGAASDESSISSSSPPCAQVPSPNSTGQPVTWAEVAEGMKSLRVSKIQAAIEAAKSNGFTAPQVIGLIEVLKRLRQGLCNSPAGALYDRLQTNGAAEWDATQNWPWQSDEALAEPSPYDIPAAVKKVHAERLERENQQRAKEFADKSSRLETSHGAVLNAMDHQAVLELIGGEKLVRKTLEARGRDAPEVRVTLLQLIDIRLNRIEKQASDDDHRMANDQTTGRRR